MEQPRYSPSEYNFPHIRLPTMTASILTTFVAEKTIGARRRKDLFERLSKHRLPGNQELLIPSEAVAMTKLAGLRPRLIAALGVYSAVNKITYEELQNQGGLDNFYLFWSLGGNQDDVIDEHPKNIDASKTDIKNQLRRRIFADDEKNHSRIFSFLVKELKHHHNDPQVQDYITTALADWYKFLIDQESDVIRTPFDVYSLEFCKNYREQQNSMAGRTAVVCLNGNTCLDSEKQKLEGILPQFSFLTQMIDDIADTFEDIRTQRPSYAVGALQENSAELRRIQALVESGKFGKSSPTLLATFAPKSYQLLEQTFKDYQINLGEKFGVTGQSIGQLGEVAFHFFPRLRHILYYINPKLSYF